MTQQKTLDQQIQEFIDEWGLWYESDTYDKNDFRPELTKALNSLIETACRKPVEINERMYNLLHILGQLWLNSYKDGKINDNSITEKELIDVFHLIEWLNAPSPNTGK